MATPLRTADPRRARPAAAPNAPPYLRKAAPDVLATARAQRWDPAEVLRILVNEEVEGRNSATRRTRRHAAHFPTDYKPCGCAESQSGWRALSRSRWAASSSRTSAPPS